MRPPPAAPMQNATPTTGDTLPAGSGSSSAYLARRTSASLQAAAYLGAVAEGAKRSAPPALSPHPETMARESPLVTLLPQRKILAQRIIERLIGDEQLIIHTRPACARTKLFDMRIYLRAIARLRIFGNAFDLSIR